MIRISEIYGPVIAGEGSIIGTPTVFVRTGGCDYRCSWCDTDHAVLPRYKDQWRPLDDATIMDEVRRLSAGVPLLVTLSGGNPALYDCGPLIALGQRADYTFALETQGSVPKPWFADLDVLTLSPKPPSSGMETDHGALRACLEAAGPSADVCLKVVVFDDADYAYARDVGGRYPGVPFFLQVGNVAAKPGQEPAASVLLEALVRLSARVLADCWHDCRVLPQLHTLCHGNHRGT